MNSYSRADTAQSLAAEPRRSAITRYKGVHYRAEQYHESFALKTAALRRFSGDGFYGMRLETPVFTPIGGK